MKLKKSKFLFRLSLVAIGIAVLLNIKNTIKIAYPLHYSESVYKYSSLYEVDPMLIFSIIKAESKFFPYAKSRKEAKGLMQIMDTTYGEAKGKIGICSDSVYDTDANIQVGCWYVKELMEKFDYNSKLAVAAYNAGPSNVKKWVKKGVLDEQEPIEEAIPYEETRNYVEKVMKNYKIYKSIYER